VGRADDGRSAAPPERSRRPGGFGVVDFAISPTDTAIAYREDRAGDGRYALWSLDLDLTPRNLSGPLQQFQDVQSYRISPDGQRVVHLADRNSDDSEDLFGTPIDSGEPLVQYNESSLPSGPVLGDVTAFALSADGTQVVYRADQESDESFVAVLRSGRPEQPAGALTGSLSDDGDVQPEFSLAPDGQRVVFRYGLSPQVLYSAPISGATPPIALDSALSGSPQLVHLPDASAVVYTKFATGGTNLYSVAVDGSQAPVTLIDTPTGGIWDFQVTPDSLTVVASGGSPIELFRVPSDGSAPRVSLTGPLVANGRVEAVRISPDSSRVVYRADQEVASRLELYVVPTDASASPVKLNGALSATEDVSEFTLTPDGSDVVLSRGPDDRQRLRALRRADRRQRARHTTERPRERPRGRHRLRARPRGTYAYYRANAVFSVATTSTGCPSMAARARSCSTARAARTAP
jgi:Tol biopolymer transport system component